MAAVPVLSVAAFAAEHQGDPDLFTPPEVWLRIDDTRVDDAEPVMAEAAARYREVTGQAAMVCVTPWNGSIRGKTMEF